MDDTKKVNVRFPGILHGKLVAEVKRRQGTIPQFSLNALVIESLRSYLDREVEPPLVASVFGPPAPRSAPVAIAERRKLVPISDL